MKLHVITIATGVYNIYLNDLINSVFNVLQKDSIINAQSDSLKASSIRWEENQKGQANYQTLATGTKEELTNTIGEMKNTIELMTNKIQSLTNENNRLKKENNKLKQQLKEKAN